MKKRIFCLALALLMLVGMLPVSSFAEGKSEYEKNETGKAVFNDDLLGQVAYITNDPTLGLNASGDYTITVDKALLSQTFYIADSYVGESGYWYKLEPLDGETMPAKLSAKPWVYQNDIPTNGYADALIITPPANTCRCCENCTGAEDCECGCEECDFCEPSTPENPCACCEDCTGAEDCQCGCEDCQFCEPTETDPTTPSIPENPCACCENCTGAEDCECGCENCQFCEPEEPEYPTLADPETNVEVTLETLPEGVDLVVKSDVDVTPQLNKYGIPASKAVFALDISLVNADNSEHQPGTGALVKIPVSQRAGTKIGILHNDTFMGVTEVLSDGTVEFYTDSFSEFAGFTVDFHYGGVDYSIAGLTSIKLSELFSAMGINEDAFSATSVVFSDNSLVTTERLSDGDWLLTSLAAFDTNETLIVTFTNRSIVIDVTDDKVISDNIWYNSGTNRHIATVSMTVGNLTSVTNKGRFYLYRSSAPETDRVELFDGEKNEARLRKNGDTRATLVINELERGNDWFYVTAERCDIWLPSDNPFAVEIKPTSGSNQPVHVDRIDRTITSGGAAGVYQKRYISANESYGNRVVKIVVNDNENHPYSENVQGLFALRSGYEWNQLDVQYISYNDYFYGSNDLRSEQSKNTTDGRNHYNPDTQANFYSYNSGVYTIPLKTRYYITFHGNTATDGSMEVQPFIWSESKKLSPNRYIKAYEVIYNANGGSVSTTDANTKSTATFLGWAESPSGALKYGLDVLDVPVSNLSGDPGGKINLYAKWSDMSTVILPNPTKPSGTIEFLGWYNSNGIRVGGAGDNYTPTADEEELIARWEYSINYNLNEGTVNPANPSSYNIETDTFILTNPTKEGYTFDGWTGTGLTEKTKTVTIPKGSTGGRSYTANWTGNYYYLTFDFNGGNNGQQPSGPHDAQMGTGRFCEVTWLNPNREGYDFAGWFDAASGGTKVYYGDTDEAQDAAKVSGYCIPGTNYWNTSSQWIYTNNLDLYAHWTPKTDATYTVHYYKEGTTEKVQNDKVVNGATFDQVYSETAPETIGHYTLVGAKTQSVTAGYSNNVITFYYKQNASYSVSYQYTGTVPAGAQEKLPAEATINVGDSVTVAEAPTLAGYTFSGWTTDDATVNNGKFTMPAKAVTFTGSWTKNTYTITYNHNDKDTNPATSTVSYDIEDDLTLAQAPTRDGYEFKGWKLENVTGTNWTAGTFNGGAVFSGKYGDVTFVAQWKKIHTVVWKNGTTVLETDKVVDGESASFDGEKPTKEKAGYECTFAYWFINDTDGDSLNGTTIQNVTKDLEIVARFDEKPVEYTITYDLAGGVLPAGEISCEKNYTFNDSVTLMKAPTKDGYRFTGWLLNETLDYPVGHWKADTYGASQSFNPGKYGNITLVAQWERQTGNLVLDYVGDGAPAIVNVSGEGLNINLVISADKTIVNLPTGDYTVTAQSGNASYSASVDPSGANNADVTADTANPATVKVTVASRGLKWFTGFHRMTNRCS